MKQLIGVILLLVTLFGVGCQQDKPAYTHLEGQAQGTTFSIIYQDSLQRDYAAPIDSLFRLIDKSMSLWDSTSIITRMNQNDTSIRADKHLQRVFDVSEAVSASTGGAFDITVGPLVRTWGFSYKKNLPFPDSAVVDSLKSLIGYQKVHLDKGRLVKADPRMEIDLNAIAQGYTVDVMAEFFGGTGRAQLHDRDWRGTPHCWCE
ncbi:MAG: FAD:protein FMN transferase [Lewinellaceae bacterium]|nr:FAD:protein FMN transferase [Lewinellaceae bacterium]